MWRITVVGYRELILFFHSFFPFNNVAKTSVRFRSRGSSRNTRPRMGELNYAELTFLWSVLRITEVYGWQFHSLQLKCWAEDTPTL